jgi:hypothetical protein
MSTHAGVEDRHIGRGYRAAIAAFVIGLLVGSVASDMIRPAFAQVANPTQQRLETNQNLDQLNAKVAELLTVLRTGTLKVRVVETDKTGSAAKSPSDRSEPAASPSTGFSRGPVVSPGTAAPAR